MQPTGERTGVVSDRRLALTDDGRLVPDTDVDASIVVYPVGSEIQPRHIQAFKRLVAGHAPEEAKTPEPPADDLEPLPPRRRRAPAKKAAPRKATGK